MAVSVFKTFSAGEVLTAADLNSSLTQITNNGEALGWPATVNKDLDGNLLVLDGDADSTWGASSDDIAVLTLQGSAIFTIDGSTASAVNGTTLTGSDTGNDVVLAATGDDTDITLDIQAKGVGVVTNEGADTFNPIAVEVFT